jgi:5-methylcytosine-specific restriction enzyme subunit McrC
MQIPIQNIYFLLCYSWDKLEEKEVVSINTSGINELVDLFAKVLINGMSFLLKRGLDRDYKLNEDLVSGVKGKMNVSNTLKKNALLYKKTSCEFDEFDYDILHNQILRTTLEKLLKTDRLDENLKHDVWSLLKRLPYIQNVMITPSIFKQVRLHRNNRFYDFLLNVCYIINENLHINEETGNFKFREFIRDENKMPYVFENFVRNFYKLEQSEFDVYRENIKWQLTPEIETDARFLPKMETDVTLRSIDRKIIIDTKFYKEALKTHFSAEKLISQNLYQLFAYIENQKDPEDPVSEKCEGMLLYPTVSQSLSKTYYKNHNRISVQSVNLNQDWKKIRDDLFDLIEII